MFTQFSIKSSFRFLTTFTSKTVFILLNIESPFRLSTIFTSKTVFTQFSVESLFQFSTILISFEFSTTSISKTVFLIFFRDETDETNIDAKNISIVKLTTDTSDVTFNNTSAFIRYISLIRLRQIFVQRELNENCQLFFFVALESFVAFEFQHSIIIDLKSRKNTQ